MEKYKKVSKIPPNGIFEEIANLFPSDHPSHINIKKITNLRNEAVHINNSVISEDEAKRYVLTCSFRIKQFRKNIK